jgi:hypothetical protein
MLERDAKGCRVEVVNMFWEGEDFDPVRELWRLLSLGSRELMVKDMLVEWLSTTGDTNDEMVVRNKLDVEDVGSDTEELLKRFEELLDAENDMSSDTVGTEASELWNPELEAIVESGNGVDWVDSTWNWDMDASAELSDVDSAGVEMDALGVKGIDVEDEDSRGELRGTDEAWADDTEIEEGFVEDDEPSIEKTLAVSEVSTEAVLNVGDDIAEDEITSIKISVDDDTITNDEVPTVDITSTEEAALNFEETVTGDETPAKVLGADDISRDDEISCVDNTGIDDALTDDAPVEVDDFLTDRSVVDDKPKTDDILIPDDTRGADGTPKVEESSDAVEDSKVDKTLIDEVVGVCSTDDIPNGDAAAEGDAPGTDIALDNDDLVTEAKMSVDDLLSVDEVIADETAGTDEIIGVDENPIDGISTEDGVSNNEYVPTDDGNSKW